MTAITRIYRRHCTVLELVFKNFLQSILPHWSIFALSNLSTEFKKHKLFFRPILSCNFNTTACLNLNFLLGIFQGVIFSLIIIQCIVVLFVTQLFQIRFRSVVVITCASHAQGPRFDPGRKHFFFYDFNLKIFSLIFFFFYFQLSRI